MKLALIALAYGFIAPAVSVLFEVIIGVILPVLILFIIDGNVAWDFTPVRDGILCLYKFGIIPGLCSGLYMALQFKHKQPLNLFTYYGLSLAALLVMQLINNEEDTLLVQQSLKYLVPAILLNAFVFLQVMKRRLGYNLSNPITKA